MNAPRDMRPRGFGRVASSWQDLLPADGVVRLPGDGIADGPVLALPDGPIRALFIEAWTESLGNVERFVRRVHERLEDGGGLFLDVANARSPAALREVIEGRVAPLEPGGSLCDPELRLSPRRLLTALERAGFHVEDVLSVPSPAASCGEAAPSHLVQAGFVAASWFAELPPARLWISAARRSTCAGSILVGPGDGGLQRHTIRSVQAHLPSSWEIVACEGADTEPQAFNAAVARARGEVLWFLRAGARIDAEQFAAMRRAVTVAPAAPASRGDAAVADPSGLMVARRDVLLAGPFTDRWHSDSLIYEEWGVRLQVVTRAPQLIAGTFSSPTAAHDPKTLAEESAAFIEQWHVPDAEPVEDAGSAEPPPWAGRAPRVSLCMIARDEEEFLGECLRRAAPAVDEIVLVDTGSTDRTVEIAESFGAQVLREPWNDDFAAPRNRGMAAATGDWILILDADEYLEDDFAPRMRELVQDPGVCGYHIVFHNAYSGGKTQGVTMVRLFRRLDGVRFENAIHEQVTPSLVTAGNAAGLHLATSDLKVVHHGYRDEVMEARGKNERNERLFRKQLERSPDDVYSLYKFGDFLRRFGDRSEESLTCLERALEIIWAEPPGAARGLPYAGEIAALCALEHAKRGRSGRAVELVERALRTFTPTPNLHYITASLALADGRSDDAMAHFERCFAYRDQILVVPVQDGVTSYVALTGIAQARLQRGEIEPAKALLEHAVELAPNYDVAAMALSRLHLQEGDFTSSLHVLTEFLGRNPESIGVCQQAALILQKLDCTDQARAIGQRAVELMEQQSLNEDAQRLREQLAAMA